MAARPLSPPPLSLLHSTIRRSKPGPSRFRTFSFPSTPLHLPTKSASPHSYSPFFSYRHQQKPRHEGGGEEQQHVDDEEHEIGDCLVFEEGAFEGGVIDEDSLPPPPAPTRRKPQAVAEEVKAESLVPERWKEVVAEINMTKKEKRVIARELRFGSKVERRRRMMHPPGSDLEEYREMKLSQLKPVVLDDPVEPPPPPRPPSSPEEDGGLGSGGRRTSERVAPRNPRLEVAGEGFEAINEFFSSGDYVPGEVNDDKKPKGSRKLFTKEEKVLLNRRIPSLAEATSRKWLPLHALAASGEFYLLDALLKHNVDINAVDTDGLSAIHKAILGKKQAILNFLLRESANPFVRDNDGATLIHYAVQTASSPAIKILILYNVDINLSDNDGWTPLHLAVQTQRTDIVKLLLIKGADKTLKNKDGLTPLDLCLYSGRSASTFELIKLLKGLPRSKQLS